MTELKRTAPLSVEEYLLLEQTNALRHELIGGELYAMVGSTDTHNLIAGGLEFALRLRLRNSGCRVFRETHKLRVVDDVFYPDVFMVCNRTDSEALYKASPVLIAEVLSDSTARRDRVTKLNAYKTLESLETYLILAQTALEAEVYQRAGRWRRQRYRGREQNIAIPALKLEIPLQDIYADVLEELED